VAFQNPEALPSALPGIPENLLAPFWDDLDFGAARRAKFWSDGSRFIVQYTDVTRVGGGPSFTFQVVLHPSGRIVVQYLKMDGLTTSATIGIQNADRTIGLLAAFDEPYVHDGLALAFDRAPAWLGLAPLSGVIPPGGAADLTLDLSASGLAAGDYEAGIALATGDPFHAASLVPVVLHVGEVPLDFAVISPQTIIGSPKGNTVLATLQLPAGYDPRRVDVSTISAAGSLLARPSPVSFGDSNGDGILEISVRFDRAALLALLPSGTAVPVMITGEVRDTVWFRGTAIVRTSRRN
jgi:hypothetical protein